MSDAAFSAAVKRRAGRAQRNGTLEDALLVNRAASVNQAASPVDDEPSGDYIQTYTGKRFFPADPRPDQIDIEDIARALSRLCRFAGHCNHFYSVAQHSVYVSGLVPLEDQFDALMHDATEAYVVDMPRPIKKMLPDYIEIEHNVWLAIAKKFGLSKKLPASVKEADNRMLLREKDVLLKPSAAWPIPGTPAPIDIFPMDDSRAYWFFMRRFNMLMEQRNA